MFTFAGIIVLALAPTSWWVGILIWALLALGYAFDSADGQVARLRGGGSVAGEWLDHVVDCLKISSLHLVVLVTAFLHFHLTSPGWLLIPIGCAIVNAVAFFAMILNDQLKAVHASRPTNQSGQASPGRASPAPATCSVLRSLLLLPTDYGILCLVFSVRWLPRSLSCALRPDVLRQRGVPHCRPDQVVRRHARARRATGRAVVMTESPTGAPVASRESGF